MVSATTQSVLDEFTLDWDHNDAADDTPALTTGRVASRKREQASSARYGTQRRYSRQRTPSTASRGPRRRLRKSVS